LKFAGLVDGDVIACNAIDAATGRGIEGDEGVLIADKSLHIDRFCRKGLGFIGWRFLQHILHHRERDGSGSAEDFAWIENGCHDRVW